MVAELSERFSFTVCFMRFLQELVILHSSPWPPMLKAANEGQYNFLNEVKIYGERARKLKEIFLRHGFHLVYDNDLGEPIADGFYFTIGYPGMTSGELAKELMYYGVSAISLVTTGSHQEGLRACTSFIKDHQYAQLDEMNETIC